MCHRPVLKLKSGLIRVFSHRPGDPRSGIPGSGCGYMPQEVALDDDLTIEETLTYFARLHNLIYSDIKERINHLVEFLDLQSSSCEVRKLVGELSGGQRRRVSFAAALIHKPRLIILDEPTVGVDPILRERIWEALIQITEVDKMTVIITTHYIEETRRAHSVAFMRRGVLLVEDSPASLISRFESSSLEDVFYKLSLAQKKQTQLIKQTLHKEQVKGLRYKRKRTSVTSFGERSQTTQSSSANPIDISFNSFESTVSSSSSQAIPPHEMRDTVCKQINAWLIRYQTVTRKIMIQSFRQSNLMFLQFFLPLISLFLFCTCIGHTPKDVQLMVVVNEENPELLSKIFLRNINTDIISITRSNNLEDAFKVVKARDAWGVVHIKSNFSSAMIHRALFYESETGISNETIAESTIKIYADLTNRVLSVTMQRTLEGAFESFITDALTQLDYNPKLLQYPIILADVVFGSASTMDYFAIREYGIPGLLVILTYSCAFASTVLILNGESTEQKDDFMDRNFVAGVTTAHLIMSHLTSRLLVMTVNVLTLLVVAIYFFEAPSRGNVFVSIILLILQSVAGLTHGMLISSISRSFFMAMVLSNFVLLGMFIISGVFMATFLSSYMVKVHKLHATNNNDQLTVYGTFFQKDFHSRHLMFYPDSLFRSFG